MQKIPEQLQTERNILGGVWHILVNHVDIEEKDRQALITAAEWKSLVEECEKLYYTGGNAAQEKLAQGMARAVMDYYSELSRTDKED